MFQGKTTIAIRLFCGRESSLTRPPERQCSMRLAGNSSLLPLSGVGTDGKTGSGIQLELRSATD